LIVRWLKAIAITITIAVAAVVIVTVGAFIGGVLLFLGAVAGVCAILYVMFSAHRGLQAHERSMREKR